MNNQKTNKMPNLVSYQLDLIERLKNRDYAIVYLNAALEESIKGDAESQDLFLRDMRNVAEAQGSISELARQSHIRLDCLYRMLSKKGNPELNSLVSLLHAMGFSLSVR